MDAFWDNVNKTDGCWLWTGPVDADGYGLMYVNGIQKRAHRHSYELHWSVIPKSYFVRHTCDVPGCVNPDHLVFGSAKQNSDDMIKRDRSNKNKKIKRLNANLRNEIRSLYETGNVSTADVAKRYGINRRTVTRILAERPVLVTPLTQNDLKLKILQTIEALRSLVESL